MDYIEIIATVPASQTEQAADALRSATGADVWIEAPFTQVDLESDADVHRDGSAQVHAYVPRDHGGDVAGEAARALGAEGIDPRVAVCDVAEEDWAESWKEYFHVERYGERIVVVPSWRAFQRKPGDVVLTLDPGMAFGTGQHETTRMCLEAIERHVRPGMRVLDAGCGSGILAIAAALLGAGEVRAVDVDPNCVRVTESNARANRADAIVRAAEGSLGDAWPFAEPAAGFDLIVANIIARVIIEIAAPLVAALAPGGRLIVSGVIGERERETYDALAAAGARVESVRAMGDWRCIEAVAPGGAA